MGPLAGFLLTGSHFIDLPAKIVLGFALFVAPPALVEMWWRQRWRRAGEQVLVLPVDRPARRLG